MKKKKTHVVDRAKVYRAEGAYEELWQEIEKEFAEMVGLGRENGFRIVLLYLPLDLSKDQSRTVSRFTKWSETRGVPFIDLTPQMLAASKNEMLYWPKDGHCTPAGYRVMSDTIFKSLEERKVVP